MKKFLPTLNELCEALARLPGIGPKAAQRIGFHLLRRPEEELEALSGLIKELRSRVKPCSSCWAWSESDPCWVCADPGRDRATLCVVEEVSNLFALERSGTYRGLYHVLHGVLSPLDGVGPEELRIESLVQRLEKDPVKEVILALNPTLEGENTSRYISLLLENKGVKTTRIASGVPVGGDLEFVDDLTLSRSMAGRQEFGKSR